MALHLGRNSTQSSTTNTNVMKPTVTYSRKSSKRRHSAAEASAEPQLDSSPLAAVKFSSSKRPRNVEHQILQSDDEEGAEKRRDKGAAQRHRPPGTHESSGGHEHSSVLGSFVRSRNQRAETTKNSTHISPLLGKGTRAPTHALDSPSRCRVLTPTKSLPSLPSRDRFIDDASPGNPARDLMSSFDLTSPIVPNSISGSPISQGRHGLAKRMLKRSRTDVTLGDVSLGNTLSATFSPLQPKFPAKDLASQAELPGPTSSFLSRTIEAEALSEEDNIVSGGSPSRLLGAISSSARTYAGPSRSFLVAIPRLSLIDTQLPAGASSQETDYYPEQDETEIRDSYTDLRARWGVDNSEDDPLSHSSAVFPSKGKGKGKDVDTPSLPNGLVNELKSITELRSKGESRWFLDEAEYLLEGLESSATKGLRRTSALELVTKLSDMDFCRKAAAADFFGSAWAALRAASEPGSDKIMDVLSVLFAALISRDRIAVEDLTGKSDLVNTLIDMITTLHRQNDVLELIGTNTSDKAFVRLGLGRADKQLLRRLSEIAKGIPEIPQTDKRTSLRLLIAHVLCVLPPSVMPSKILKSLIESLKSELSVISEQITGYISGLPLFSEPVGTEQSNTPFFNYVDTCLRLLERTLLPIHRRFSGEDKDDFMYSFDEEIRGDLVGLCVSIEILSRDARIAKEGFRCLESALRVLATLSHLRSDWCLNIARDEFIIALLLRIMHASREALAPNIENEDRSSSPDSAALSLALLTNLVQGVPEMSDRVRQTYINRDCSIQGTCLRSCQCLSRVGGLQYLVSIYLDNSDVFLRGHMALLFGLLMRDSITNERVVLDALTGPSNSFKLERLVQEIHAFKGIYDSLSVAHTGSNQGHETVGGLERLNVNASSLIMQEIEHASKEVELVTVGVLGYFNELRNK